MPKLTWAKGPLFVEEGGLFFRVSAVCDIRSLHFIFYAQLVKVLFKSGWLNTKIITGGITVKVCYGITKQCTDNVHFTNTPKSELHGQEI